jgi:hypothetical protein
LEERMLRKAEGTETRPLASILFVAFERNRFITQNIRFQATGPAERDHYALVFVRKSKVLSCICAQAVRTNRPVCTKTETGLTTPFGSAFLG